MSISQRGERPLWVSALQTYPRVVHVDEWCIHFYEEKRPRPATPAERITCRPCETCTPGVGSGRAVGPRGGVSPTAKTAAEFLCQQCFCYKPLSLQVAPGLCHDCAG